MLQKCLPLVGALVLAGPASAITVNMSRLHLRRPASVDMDGSDGSPSYEGSAGEFSGGVVDGRRRPRRFASPPRPRRGRSSPGAPR